MEALVNVVRQWSERIKSSCRELWVADRAWKKWIGWPGKIGMCFWVFATMQATAPMFVGLLCMFAAVVLEQLRLVKMLEKK